MASLLNYTDNEWDALLNDTVSERERKILIAAREKERRSKQSDQLLYSALEVCVAGRADIKPLQDKFWQMADQAKNQIERDARLWQRDSVKWRIEAAAKGAENRLKLLSKLRTEGHFKDELKKCANGKKGAVRYFQYWAWGFDPRPLIHLSIVPLIPFKNQIGLLGWLEDTVFGSQESGLIEKSRDEGATLVCVNWCVLKWLTVSGFVALMGSRKKEMVDDKKAIDTIFQKVRLQVRLLPKKMLPDGYDQRTHSSDMLLDNPEKASQIVGEAPTETFGAGRRATVAIADEFALWPYDGFPQYTSCVETTRSFIALSTPRGKYNKYAKLRFPEEGKCNFYVLDWKNHPWKDRRWYDSLPYGYTCPKMSKEIIAQEVDHDYEASQPGRVWPHYHEPHVVITYSEFRKFFERYLRFPVGDEYGERRRLPTTGYTGRLNDRGATTGHRNAWLWFWRPPEGCPLADSVFFHREWLAPIGVTYREIAEYVLDVEKPDQEGGERLRLSQNSHEAESERNNYALEHGIFMEGWKTDYERGIAEIGEFLTVIDKNKPNPIRPRYVEEGETFGLMGRTRIYIIGANSQADLRYYEGGVPYVQIAKDFDGMVNLRRQISGYHYPPEEAGKPVGQMRPEKKDDDLCFVAGTMVRTKDGNVPIEDISPFDLIFTRDGYKSSSGAILTNSAAQTLIVKFSDGTELQGTAKHPVWVEGKGFLPIDGLRAFDIVQTCRDEDGSTNEKARWWNSTGFGTTVIPTPQNVPTEFISKHTMLLESWATRLTTLISGSPFMEPCPSDTKFITKMEILSTMSSQTWRLYQYWNIDSITWLDNVRIIRENTWKKFDLWRLNGMEVKKGSYGTQNTVRRYGRLASLLQKFARTVGILIKQSIGELVDFVRRYVKMNFGVAVDLFHTKETVLNAAHRLRRIAQRKITVPLHVVSVEAVESTRPVYNLSVHEQPEYFANDILVHNCDCMRAAAIWWGGLTEGKTHEQKLQEELLRANKGFDLDEIEKLVGWPRQGRLAALGFAKRDIERRERDERQETGSAVADHFTRRQRALF